VIESFLQFCLGNDSLNLNYLTLQLNDMFRDAINRHVTQILVKKDNFPNWYSGQLRSAIIIKRFFT